MRLNRPPRSGTDLPILPIAKDCTEAGLDGADFAALMAPLGPFEAAPRLAVAVSGGADSLALALLAARWAAERGGEAVALTVDHRLRADSAGEAEQVRRWLSARGIAHRTLVWSGPHPTADLQAAARDARYRLMAEWCARRNVLHLLLAHHRDDQAETVLLRLARGSGIDGLAAMAPVSEVALPGAEALPGLRLLRPLLPVAKAALEATLRATGQNWIEDPSNRSDAFARARMRRLLPLLAAEGLTPERLVATAGHLARARAALDEAVAGLAAEAVAVDPAGYLRLNLDGYRAAPAETALRCLSHCLVAIGGGIYPPRFERLERLHADLARQRPGGPPLKGRTLGGCRIVIEGPRALICRELADITDDRTIRAGQVVWWDRRFLLRLAGTGTARLGPLRAAGWRTLLQRSPELRRNSIPAPVRPTLPALFNGMEPVEVPHLGYRRAGAGGPHIVDTEPAPRQVVAPAWFMVV